MELVVGVDFISFVRSRASDGESAHEEHMSWTRSMKSSPLQPSSSFEV